MTVELSYDELKEIYIILEARADNCGIESKQKRLYNLANRLREESRKASNSQEN